VSGTLAPANSIGVETSLNALANALPPGVHTCDVVFTNVTSGYVQTRSVSLEVFEGHGEIETTDSIPPVDDLDMPFGTVAAGDSRTEQITVSNTDPTFDLTVTNVYLGFAGWYTEDFNDGLAQDWEEITDPDWEVLSGEYRAHSDLLEQLMQSHYTGQVWQDCAVRAIMRRTGDTGSVAVLFARATADFSYPGATGNAYAVGISGNGNFWVAKFIAGAWNPFQSWTASPYLNTGEVPNEVVLSVNGATIDVYFNGDLAWTGSDTEIPDAGRIGLVGYSGGSSLTTHYFDDVVVGEPVTAAASISTEQQWYNSHAYEGGSLDTAPANWQPPVYSGPSTADGNGRLANEYQLAGLPSFPFVLAPGASFTFDVIFAPTEEGYFENTVHIESNDDDEPEVIVTLSGTGGPGGNLPPVAVDDAYVVDEDMALTVPAPGVLGNDTDPEDDPLTAVPDVGPTHGTLTLNADGSFEYVPNANYFGEDTFTYYANDGTQNSELPATVTITVNPVNDPPVAVDDAYTVDEGGTLNLAAPGVLENDWDPDGDDLTAMPDVGPTHGTLTLNPDGLIIYTHDGSETTSDSFTYYANDGTVNSELPATVTITVNPVNDPPLAVDDVYAVDEDDVLTVPAPGVLGNDTDPEDDPLTTVLDAGPVNGTLTLNADGSFEYIPNADYFGEDSFTYYANDGTVNSEWPATVTITVNPINDPPVAVDDAYTVNQDDVLVVAAPGVLGNDADVENDPLSAVLDSGPVNGALTLNADGSFEYVPDAGYLGEDSFTYFAYDGTVNSELPATVTISVLPVDMVANRSFWYYKYASPGVEDVTVTIENLGANDLTSFGLSEELPDGWTFDSVVSFDPPGCGPAFIPGSGATGTLEFIWTCIPEFPYTFTYRVNVPTGHTGDKLFEGDVVYRRGAGAEQRAAVDCLGSVAERIHHSLDYNPADYAIGLSEILRLIQFYNMGGYHCVTGPSEDGYEAGPGTVDACCVPHDSDYNPQDWQIGLSEVLRAIQFYNMGGYHVAEGTEDGYVAGPAAATEMTKSLGAEDSGPTPEVPLPALYAVRDVARGRNASDITVSFEGIGAEPISALALVETLPEGWIFEGIVDASEPPAVAPIEGDSGELEFVWLWPPTLPAQVTYRIRSESGKAKGEVPVGEALYRTTGIEQQTEVAYGEPQTLYVDAAARKEGNGTKGKPFATIAEAIEACVGGRGDMIVLGPGAYCEQSLVLKPYTTLVSESGAYSTHLAGTESNETLLVVTEGCVVRGLTLNSAGVALRVGAGMDAEVTNCVFHTNSVGLMADNGASLVLANNTVYGNGPYGVWGGPGATFVLLANNLFAGNDTALFADPGALLSSGYNDWFGNGVDLDGPAGSSTDLAVEPLFVDESALDLRLGEDSLCRDAGDPAEAFQDVDGTRNDIGAEGGPYGVADEDVTRPSHAPGRSAKQQ